MKRENLEIYGQSLIGKSCQSRLLTELTATGKKVLCAPAKITAFEIVEVFQEPVLMVKVDGEMIYEDTCINIH